MSTLAAVQAQRAGRRSLGVLASSAVLLLLAVTTAPTCLRGIRYLRAAAPYSEFDREERDWGHAMLRAGFWLRDNIELGPDERVACVSCGALALVFPDRLLALDGLASDEAASYVLTPGRGASLVPLLRKYGARYLVDVEGAFVDPDVELRPLYRQPFTAGVYTVAMLVYPSDRAK